jgi:capsular exopolysaccharide synthesis family protein
MKVLNAFVVKPKIRIAKSVFTADYIEAFKFLRTNILVKAYESGLKKLIFTSAAPKDGKTTAAVYTAISLAMIGKKVVIVDCNLYRPAVYKLLRLSPDTARGITDILSGSANVADCTVYSKEYNVYAVLTGTVGLNSIVALDTEQINEIIEELSGSYDFVIIDTPPVSEIADAAVIAKDSDGVVFVVRQNYTKAEDAVKAKNNLEHAGSNIIGCVVNGSRNKRSKKYNNYCGYKR